MSALLRQIGVADETVFGTIVNPVLFNEFVDESIEAEYGRTRTMNRRPGQLFGSSRGAAYFAGASGDVNMEVDSRGAGFWLKNALGAVSTSAPVSGAYTHTITPDEATFNARSMSLQVGRPDYASGVVRPFTYGGGKITAWELSSEVEANLKAKYTCDFAVESTATALAVASYPTGLETLSWVDANLTVGGVQVDVTKLTIGCDNVLKTDRRYLRRATRKKAQIRNGEANGTVSFTADFDSMTMHDKVASALASDAVATLVATWRGVTPISGAIVPQLQVTLNASLDTWKAVASGPEGITQDIGGVFLDTNAISIQYVSPDATI